MLGSAPDIGLRDEAEATGNGAVIPILKRIRTLMGGTGSLRITDGTNTVAVANSLPGVSAYGLVVRAPSGAIFVPGSSTNPGPVRLYATRNLLDGTSTFQSPNVPFVFKALNAVAVNPAASIWTPTDPGTGGKFRLMGYHLSGSVAGNYLLKDGAGGTIIAVVPSGAGGSGVFVDLGDGGILSATANNILECLGPAASTISGIVFGIEEGTSV